MQTPGKSATEWDQIIERLDRAGVPCDVQWRTLMLYMRHVRGFYFLSEQQKEEVQKLIVQTLKDGDYSEERYREIVRRQEEILVSPLQTKVRQLLRESEALLQDFKSIMQHRKGDVEELEVLSVDLVEGEQSPLETVSTMRKAFRKVVQSMESDMADLTRMSMTDGLTQLYNRRALDEHLECCVGHSLEKNRPLSLVMVDIDHFKHFNDEYGHRIGDQALRVVGEVLLNCAAELNGENMEKRHCFPARYGGEEFVVVLGGLTLDKAREIGEKIRCCVEEYDFTIQDNSGKVLKEGVRLTVSAGAAQLDPKWGGAFAANLLETADRHLYAAKESGRNCVCCQET
ncbi:MAG: GGDEF domain-containing protein [Desulfovibrionaceae bacterium]